MAAGAAPAGSWLARGGVGWVLADSDGGWAGFTRSKHTCLHPRKARSGTSAAVLADYMSPQRAASRRGTRSTGAETDARRLCWGTRCLVRGRVELQSARYPNPYVMAYTHREKATKSVAGLLMW